MVVSRCCLDYGPPIVSWLNQEGTQEIPIPFGFKCAAYVFPELSNLIFRPFEPPLWRANDE